MKKIIIYITLLNCVLDCRTNRSKYQEKLERLHYLEGASPEELITLKKNPPIVTELQRIYPDKISVEGLVCQTNRASTEKDPNWHLARTHKNEDYRIKHYQCFLSDSKKPYYFILKFYKPIPEEMVTGNGDNKDISKDFVANLKIQKYCAIDFYNQVPFGAPPVVFFPWKEKDNLLRLNKFHLHLRDMYFESGSDLCNKEENPDLP